MKCKDLELVSITVHDYEIDRKMRYRSDLVKAVNQTFTEKEDRELIDMWLIDNKAYLLLGGE